MTFADDILPMLILFGICAIIILLYALITGSKSFQKWNETEATQHMIDFVRSGRENGSYAVWMHTAAINELQRRGIDTDKI